MRGGKVEFGGNRGVIGRQNNYQGNRRMNFNGRMQNYNNQNNQGGNRPFKSNPK